MVISKSELGQIGEDLAEEYLKGRGYRIIQRNYRTRSGEIDIVAEDKDILCFVEVKTRTDESRGHPLESISPFKKRKMVRAALCYLKDRDCWDVQARFDVVAVEPAAEGKYNLELIENAFELES